MMKIKKITIVQHPYKRYLSCVEFILNPMVIIDFLIYIYFLSLMLVGGKPNPHSLFGYICIVAFFPPTHIFIHMVP